MIKVCSDVPIYEVNDVEVSASEPSLSVVAHWNNQRIVVLHIDGKRLSVAASDLHAAIQNATNSARH